MELFKIDQNVYGNNVTKNSVTCIAMIVRMKKTKKHICFSIKCTKNKIQSNIWNFLPIFVNADVFKCIEKKNALAMHSWELNPPIETMNRPFMTEKANRK